MGGDGFLHLMNQTLEETMLGEGFSQTFVNDIVAPITRVNYGQSVRINAFVGQFPGACFCLLFFFFRMKLMMFVSVWLFRSRFFGGSRLQPVGGGRRQQEGVFGLVVPQQERRHRRQSHVHLSQESTLQDRWAPRSFASVIPRFPGGFFRRVSPPRLCVQDRPPLSTR